VGISSHLCDKNLQLQKVSCENEKVHNWRWIKGRLSNKMIVFEQTIKKWAVPLIKTGGEVEENVTRN